MTLIVGIQCSDGVVMASDSAATLSTGLQPTVGQQSVTKVTPIGGAILYSSTGAIGMSQVLMRQIAAEYSANVSIYINRAPTEAMHKLGEVIARAVAVYAMNAQFFQQAGGLSGAFCKSLVAMPTKDGPWLFQFDCSGAPEHATKQLPLVALGSGQPIADPFLAFLRRILWSDREPTVAEGRLVAAWTVSHVAATNPGGVALPLQLSCLITKDGAPVIEPMEDASEHQMQIEAAEESLREHILKKGPIAEAPSQPAAPKTSA